MFKLVHKNKKGFTLVELLVCIAIFALVLPLAGQVLFSLTGLNGVMADKWHVQTAVRMACAEFDAGNDSLTNAYQVDIIYDPVVNAGVKLDTATGKIEWIGISGKQYPYTLPLEDGIYESDLYTYIFSAPTWDATTEEYLGELLYIRNYLSKNTEFLLGGVGFGYTPVAISFSLATTEFVSSENVKYTDESIFVSFSSGDEDMAHYDFMSAFALVNNTRSINLKEVAGDEMLVFEQKWLDASGNPCAYPAGWTDYSLNTDDDGNYVTSAKFPASTTNDSNTRQYTARYLDSDNAVKDVAITETFEMTEDTNENGYLENREDLDNDDEIDVLDSDAPVLAKEGNVLRYITPTAQSTQGDVAERKTGANIATCLTGWAMMGSDLEETVLTNLRAFRDDVLKGTAFGDWFIEQYYYVWSPFVVNNLEALKPVIKAVLIPVSYICGEIAK